jgi:hypothetical protein
MCIEILHNIGEDAWRLFLRYWYLEPGQSHTHTSPVYNVWRFEKREHIVWQLQTIIILIANLFGLYFASFAKKLVPRYFKLMVIFVLTVGKIKHTRVFSLSLGYVITFFDFQRICTEIYPIISSNIHHEPQPRAPSIMLSQNVNRMMHILNFKFKTRA